MEYQHYQDIGFTLWYLHGSDDERVVSFGKMLKLREIMKIPEGVRK